MGEKDKRRYAYGGFPPTGKLYIQQDSYLICDDLDEELATIPTSMLKQKMRNIDSLLDASSVFYGTFGTFYVNKQEELIMHRYEIVQERATLTIIADSMKIREDSLIVFEQGKEIRAIVNSKDIKYILRIE